MSIINESNSKTLTEIDQLSSGTMANITGLKTNIELERMNTIFGNWVYAQKDHFENWSMAWIQFCKEHGFKMDSRGNIYCPSELRERFNGIL